MMNQTQTWGRSGIEFFKTLTLSVALALSTSACLSNLDSQSLLDETGDSVETSAYREVNLTKMTTDAIPGLVGNFTALIDESGDTKVLRYVDNQGKRLDFDVTALNRGVVLMVEKGREIAKLTGKNFDTRSGGEITLRYLYEGGLSSDTFRTVELEADRSGEKWTLFTNTSAGRTSFTEMFLKKNEKPFLGIVGIKEIVFK
jgi:hypothetical protein